jgi:3-carboxy-cis,cis-muconate lactonizing enzyme.
MPSRRTFLSLLAGGAVAPHLAFAQGRPRRLALYANVGPVLTHYDVDLANAELVKRDSVTLPAGVQYCWPHANRRYLYVASSDSAAGNVQIGTAHHVTAFKIDPATGALEQIGDPMRLPVRPIHMTLDNESQHILVAFNNPSSCGCIGFARISLLGKRYGKARWMPGIYAHQVRVTPDGRHVVLVTRGNEGTAQRAEDPGALMVFDYKNGMLSTNTRSRPTAGVAMARAIWIFIRRSRGCTCRSKRRTRSTCTACRMANRSGSRVQQDHSARAQQHPLAPGGEHGARASEWAFRIRREPLPGCGGLQWEEGLQGRREQHRRIRNRPGAGEPTAIQHIETQKFHPRTFHIDPSGRMLVAQHNLPMDVRDGAVYAPYRRGYRCSA